MNVKNLSEKLNSRKLWIVVAWVLIALVNEQFAKDMVPVVMTYLGAQGLTDAFSNHKK